MKVSAISMNETKYFNIREEDKQYIQEIRSVYCYNPESSTHYCELTPSYDLRYLHSYIVFSDAFYDLDTSKVQDDLQTELEERYCQTGENEDTNMHVADVRQFAKNNPSFHKECGEFDSMDDAIEHLNGNWPF